jgi:hypothetical protein
LSVTGTSGLGLAAVVVRRVVVAVLCRGAGVGVVVGAGVC